MHIVGNDDAVQEDHWQEMQKALGVLLQLMADAPEKHEQFLNTTFGSDNKLNRNAFALLCHGLDILCPTLLAYGRVRLN